MMIPLRWTCVVGGLLTLVCVGMTGPQFAIAASDVTIVSRAAWGADEALRHAIPAALSNGTAPTNEKGENGGSANAVSARIAECNALQNEFHDEFIVERTVSTDASGKKYLWPLQYSSSIKLLTVHHTALAVTGDPRSPRERMQALYRYHAASRGWGDIGYHFVIDEEGTIYEGRAGGERVVGGHAYCNNIGSIGIALMGNFEVEKPSIAQAISLQRLLLTLADTYGIDPRKSVVFHGKTFSSPIVLHSDLLSTACPGESLEEGFPQIRSNVLEGKPLTPVVFRDPAKALTISKPSTLSAQATEAALKAPGVQFTGRTSIGINPGGKQRLSFSFTAGDGGAYEGKKVADVKISHPDLKLWVDDGFHLIPVTKGVLLPYDLPAGETLPFQMIVQAPLLDGSYTIDIGGIRLAVTVQGRRARSGEFISPYYTDPLLIVKPKGAENARSSSLRPRVRPQTRRSVKKPSRSANQSSVTSSASSSSNASTVRENPVIRILLSADSDASVFFPSSGYAGDLVIPPGTEVSLRAVGGSCELQHRGSRLVGGPVLRLRSDAEPLLVRGVRGYSLPYKGVLECRIVDGVRALINELPLEDYMAGIAEEPDSEPFEKQKAFAIAARTYALYYMQPAARKFPGKPYDGSDDPAVFQAYRGADFTLRNPSWERAVQETSGRVLKFQGQLIKPPYFSSDDGRTRSPLEAGWRNFPFAEIFSSKPDPWCTGLPLRGHGVGMSGCGAEAQAKEGKTAEEILQYYYPGTEVEKSNRKKM